MKHREGLKSRRGNKTKAKMNIKTKDTLNIVATPANERQK